jgi:hypothetical protein
MSFVCKNQKFALQFESQTFCQVDPFLRLVEDCRLQALNRQNEPCSRVYGSKEDDDLALKSLSNVSMNEDQSKETSISLILNSLENLSEVKHRNILS